MTVKNINMNNHGKSWTDEEKQRLLDAFDTGADIKSLVESHGRSGNAIVTVLVRLNRLIEAGKGYRVLPTTEWVSFETLKTLK